MGGRANYNKSVSTSDLSEDPVLKHSRREAYFIILLWLACLLYSVSYCYLYGYVSHESLPNAIGPSIVSLFGDAARLDRDPDTIGTPLGLGIPDWVLFGVALPWIISLLLSFYYCCFFFAEDDLTPSEDNSSPSEDYPSPSQDYPTEDDD